MSVPNEVMNKVDSLIAADPAVESYGGCWFQFYRWSRTFLRLIYHQVERLGRPFYDAELGYRIW